MKKAIRRRDSGTAPHRNAMERPNPLLDVTQDDSGCYCRRDRLYKTDSYRPDRRRRSESGERKEWLVRHALGETRKPPAEGTVHNKRTGKGHSVHRGRPCGCLYLNWFDLVTGWEPRGLLMRKFWCTLGVDKEKEESEKALRFLEPRSAEGLVEEKPSSPSPSSSVRLRFAADREVQ